MCAARTGRQASCFEAEDEPSHVEPQFYMDHDYEIYDDDFFDDDDMEDVMS